MPTPEQPNKPDSDDDPTAAAVEKIELALPDIADGLIAAAKSGGVMAARLCFTLAGARVDPSTPPRLDDDDRPLPPLPWQAPGDWRPARNGSGLIYDPRPPDPVVESDGER